MNISILMSYQSAADGDELTISHVNGVSHWLHQKGQQSLSHSDGAQQA